MREKKAFTLIEVLAATAVLSIGLVLLSSSFVRSMQQKSRLNQRLQARYVASSKLEEGLAGAPPGEGVSSAFPGLSWKRTLRDYGLDGMLEVDVTVTWSERGEKSEYTLKTLARGRR